jgi:hypothetical protein
MTLTFSQTHTLPWRSWCFGIFASVLAHGALLVWLIHSTASFGNAQNLRASTRSAVSNGTSATTFVIVLPAETQIDRATQLALTLPPLAYDISTELPALSDISIDTPAASLPNVGTKIAKCEVHIHQNARGQLEAFDFGDCTGDAEWQRTLQLALQQAGSLIDSSGEKSFPAVRTIMFRSDNLSVLAIANTLSAPDSK